MFAELTLCMALSLLAADGPANETPAAQQTSQRPVEEKKFELAQIEREIVQRTNAQRARYKLAALEVDEKLVASARGHCRWMTRNRTLRHSRARVGENIAFGQADAVEVVADWMRSSGHRANILDRGYRRIGVAAFRTPEGRIYWCQQFLR